MICWQYETFTLGARTEDWRLNVLRLERLGCVKWAAGVYIRKRATGAWNEDNREIERQVTITRAFDSRVKGKHSTYPTYLGDEEPTATGIEKSLAR